MRGDVDNAAEGETGAGWSGERGGGSLLVAQDFVGRTSVRAGGSYGAGGMLLSTVEVAWGSCDGDALVVRCRVVNGLW